MTNDSTPNSGEFDKLFAVNSIEYIKNSDIKQDDELDNLFNELSKAKNDESKRDGCQYLLKIVENVLLDPKNLKTRRIRSSNKFFVKCISTNNLFLDLMKCFGFITVDEFYVLQVVDFHRLIYGYNRLLEVYRTSYDSSFRSMEPHFFDPFKSYKHNSNVYANSESFELVTKDETKSDIDSTVKDISERDNKPCNLNDWNPCIKLDSSPVRSRKIGNEPSDSSNPSVSSLIKMYNFGKNENFESRSRKELESLKTKSEIAKKCPNVELKIKMPKCTTLTLQVPVKTLVTNVRSEIQSILIDEIKFNDWYLVEFPIKRKIRDDRTLLEEDILYRSILHLSLSNLEMNSLQIVKPEFLEKFRKD